MRSYFIFTLVGAISFLEKTVNSFDVEPYPTYRFRNYSSLSADEKNAATSLGYDKKSWNLPGTADFEYVSWWYNINMDYYDHDGDGNYYEPNPDFENNAAILGFVGDEKEDVWDCWMNHYEDYTWDDLETYDIASSYKDLGWTKEVWNDETLPAPASEDKYYSELTYKEKTAAVTICYTQKIWDYEELPFCLDSPDTINNSTNTCDWVSKDISKCNDGGVSEHCPNVCGSCDSSESVPMLSISTVLMYTSVLVFFALN